MGSWSLPEGHSGARTALVPEKPQLRSGGAAGARQPRPGAGHGDSPLTVPSLTHRSGPLPTPPRHFPGRPQPRVSAAVL